MKNMKTARSGIFRGIGYFLLALAFNLTLGGLATQYVLETWFHRAFPFLACAIIGLFCGQFAGPAAIITWTLIHFDIYHP